jgi:SNF2 family DNA or RNA helicase
VLPTPYTPAWLNLNVNLTFGAQKVKESAKLELLLDLLPEMIEEGRRILLFSQFTSMLTIIEREVDRLKIPYVLLTGDTKDRATPVERFQSGKAPLFLISLKAGGTGLNLTAADPVIHYDPWWNPAVENQAANLKLTLEDLEVLFAPLTSTAEPGATLVKETRMER